MSTLRSNVRRGTGYPKDNTLASLDVMVRPAKGIPPQVVPHLMSIERVILWHSEMSFYQQPRAMLLFGLRCERISEACDAAPAGFSSGGGFLFLPCCSCGYQLC